MVKGEVHLMSEQQLMNQKVIVVKLAGEDFAISIEYVRSIERMLEVTQIPNSLPYVEGMISLRGNVMPVIDLRKRLSMGIEGTSDQTRLVIVTVNGLDVGLIVDSANEVLDLEENQIQPTPNLMSAQRTDYLEGVAKLGGRLIMILNPELLLKHDAVFELHEVKEAAF